MASELYLGAMSGTSLDGLDIALCDFSAKHPLKAHLFLPMPKDLRNELYHLSHTNTVSLNSLYQTEQRYSEFCANTINSFITNQKLKPTDISAIGIHGQTIRHEPELTPQFTVQLADLSRVSALTGITTVGDFRRKDLALNGQGAPLVPPFHDAVFGDKTNARAIVNIGGISNITVLEPGSAPLGYDCGPGNALLDYWYSNHNEGNYDKEGGWARSGHINHAVLDKLLTEPYFSLPPPKSTGRELFNPTWLNSTLTTMAIEMSTPQDIQTTLTELTASTIALAIKQSLRSGEVFICGGGWHNSYLIERIASNLGTDFSVSSTEKLGIHPDWVEACAFAWLSSNTLHKTDSNQASATGASRNAILGGIYYP